MSSNIVRLKNCKYPKITYHCLIYLILTKLQYIHPQRHSPLISIISWYCSSMIWESLILTWGRPLAHYHNHICLNVGVADSNPSTLTNLKESSVSQTADIMLLLSIIKLFFKKKTKNLIPQVSRLSAVRIALLILDVMSTISVLYWYLHR